MTFLVSDIYNQLGTKAEYFSAFGVLCAAYLSLRLTLSVWDGVKSFYLGKLLGWNADLKKMGEWAVVTGSTDGIGKAYAEQLAKLGINIVLISRNPEKLKSVAEEIESQSKVKTKIIAVDFAAGFEIYDKIKSELDGLEIGILINNVGVSVDFPMYFLEIPDDEFMKKIINVNCHSVAMMTRMIMPQMEARGRGVIVNNASASGDVPTPLLSVYSATKAFVDFLSRCLEVEAAKKGIIVQSLLPYLVSTKMSRMKPGLFVPSATSYVKSCLGTIGVQSRTFGCPSHALQAYVTSLMPRWLYYKITMPGFMAVRKKGLSRMKANAKKE